MKKKYLFVSVFLLIIGIRTVNADCFSSYGSASSTVEGSRYSQLSSITWGPFWNVFCGDGFSTSNGCCDYGSLCRA